MQQLLRHTVATLAYRGGKAVRGAPPEFASYGEGRTAGQILAHICDLFDWAVQLADGKHVWHDSKPQAWDADVGSLSRCRAGGVSTGALASGTPLACEAEQLFQGPIADVLTHVGQIAMLRRMAGCPISGENYFVAKIETGRCGADQAAAVKEF